MRKARSGFLIIASGITFFSHHHMVSSFSTRTFLSSHSLFFRRRHYKNINNSHHLPFSATPLSRLFASNYFSTTKKNQNNSSPPTFSANMESTQQKKIITATQIPCPATDRDDDDFSLYHLQQRAQWLIENHTALGKVCLAIAGGGGHALSTLAATAGASQLLLEGTVTYDRASFQNYVRQALPTDKSFSFSSLEAATVASKAALLQGMQLQSRNVQKHRTLYALRDTVGLGSASTLKTNTPGGMSRTGKPSHGNIVATRSNGTQVCTKLVLNCHTQNRFQQDVFCSHMILQTLEALVKLEDKTAVDDDENEQQSNGENVDEPIDPTEYPGVTIEQWQTAKTTIDDDDQEGSTTLKSTDPVIAAAHRILSGEEEAVLLLPKETSSSSSSSPSKLKTMTANDFLEPLLFPVLPDNCLIFPGSFNPPHKGHVGLARAAIAKESSLSFVSDADTGKSDCDRKVRPLVFEISITNADKPAMDPTEVSRRVSQFRDILYQADNDDSDQGIPEWGILLTSAPLFADKVRMLRRYAPTPLQHLYAPAATSHDDTGSSPRWSFVIGTDTMVRVLNPKYYNNDYNSMLEAQRAMGADFVVGGRVEQTKSDGTTENSTKFVTGEESLTGLPPDVREMFVLLGESDFRVDVSSTELRARQKAGA